MATLVVVGCKKKEDDEPVKTKKDLILGSWITTNITLGPPLDTLDVWSFIPACAKDDITRFDSKTEVTYFVEDKCEPFEKDEAFLYEWINGDKDIRAHDVGDTVQNFMYNVQVTSAILKYESDPTQVPITYITMEKVK
jgi:hypothetical protein